MIAARLPFSAQLGIFWGGSGSIFVGFEDHGWGVKNIEKHWFFFGCSYFWGSTNEKGTDFLDEVGQDLVRGFRACRFIN